MKKHIILSIVLLSTFANLHAKTKIKRDLPEIKKEAVVTEESCDALNAKKPGLNGFALSAVGGLLYVNSNVTNKETGFDVKNKNKYKRLGLGLTYYKTYANNVMWGLGLDLLTDFGAKTVDASGTVRVYPINQQNQILNRPSDKGVAMKYTQKRPFTANIHAKLGYAYGNFVPYVMIGLRQTYTKHVMLIDPEDAKIKKLEKDVSFAIAPGVGFMVKTGSFGYGVEYGYHKESTFGLDGYAQNDGEIKNKGGHSVMARISYFF